jgi:hypothetical protein
LDVQPEAPELTPADMDDDVQITDVVTAAHRDAAARAAAVTLDDDEDDQEPEPVVPEPSQSGNTHPSDCGKPDRTEQ